MSYIGNSPGVASQRVETAFTATSNQTAFTPSSGYTLGYCDVYQNGVKLVNGDDYTASDGVTVTLATGAASGDSIVIVASFPRGLSDGYLKTEADARYPLVTDSSATANGVLYRNGSKALTNGSALVFDGTNLGVGVTPSAWNGFKAVQVQQGSFVSNQFSTGNLQTFLGSNVLYDGAYKYIVSGSAAARYAMNENAHLWFTAPSGTAGNAITFTQAMTLGANGFLGIGQTSPAWAVDILADTGNLLVRQTRARVIDTERNLGGIICGGYSTGTTIVDSAQIAFASSGAWTSTSAPSYMVFSTTASGSTTMTERARIDSSGNLLVGTTNNYSVGAVSWVMSKNGYVFAADNTGSANNRNWVVQPNASAAGSLDFVYSSTNTGWPNAAYAMSIDRSGRLLVGTTSVVGNPKIMTIANAGLAALHIAGQDTTINYAFSFYNPSLGGVGGVSFSNTTTTYSTSSDYRLKENIAPMTGALARVAALKPCTYTWKLDGSTGEGFIAHELQEVVPNAVTGEKDAINEDGSIKPQGIDTSFLVATLTAAIQEQQATIEQLQADVATLKGTP